ncbi:hypothetical protein AQ610_28285 [Burkholderia humptydooensis]|nr:hypothetical protein AQ610_28285 [Burkholderia humptydooensis]
MSWTVAEPANSVRPWLLLAVPASWLFDTTSVVNAPADAPAVVPLMALPMSVADAGWLGSRFALSISPRPALLLTDDPVRLTVEEMAVMPVVRALVAFNVPPLTTR